MKRTAVPFVELRRWIAKRRMLYCNKVRYLRSLHRPKETKEHVFVNRVVMRELERLNYELRESRTLSRTLPTLEWK